MREEEKLARDVYRTLGEKWGLTPFLHIQRSEEQHLALMGDLILRSGTPDPVTNDATGVFQSGEMKQLYADLIRTGMGSPVEALRAGARVEELDISDLEKAVANTQSLAVRQTYEGLLRASRNHLRAFAGNLEARGESYTPRHLPANRYAAIVAGSHEACGLCVGGAAGMGGCGMSACGNQRGAGSGCGMSAGGRGAAAGTGCQWKPGAGSSNGPRGKGAAANGRCGGAGCGGGRHGMGASSSD
jgi:hypothetical protein